MSGRVLATSEVILEETPYLNLTTKGRRTGLTRSVELWFVFEDGNLFFLAHEDSDWWKNVDKTARVEVEVGEILFEEMEAWPRRSWIMFSASSDGSMVTFK